MKKSVFAIFTVIPMLMILSLSCEKESLSTGDPIDNAPVDIYVAGNKIGATYWKNGQEMLLTNAIGSQATSMVVVDGDVYVAGWEGDGLIFAEDIAKYWKNGQEVLLSDATDAHAEDIAVSDGDVYVAGWQILGGIYVAKYWKNGQPIFLTNGHHDAEASGIVVVNGDVYVCGHEHNQAKYWKNGLAVILAHNGSPQTYANSITVVGSDVYVAGSAWEGRQRAQYWKNGEEVMLKDDTEKNASATSIVVDGTDVYVAGWAGDYAGIVGGTGSKAMYWKNEQRVELTDGKKYAYTSSIAFFDGDVYVSGTLYNDYNAADIVATYWKNGPDMPTTIDILGQGQAASILVVPQ